VLIYLTFICLCLAVVTKWNILMFSVGFQSQLTTNCFRVEMSGDAGTP
jgi:hypothetical protein